MYARCERYRESGGVGDGEVLDCTSTWHSAASEAPSSALTASTVSRGEVIDTGTHKLTLLIHLIFHLAQMMDQAPANANGQTAFIPALSSWYTLHPNSKPPALTASEKASLRQAWQEDSTQLLAGLREDIYATEREFQAWRRDFIRHRLVAPERITSTTPRMVELAQLMQLLGEKLEALSEPPQQAFRKAQADEAAPSTPPPAKRARR